MPSRVNTVLEANGVLVLTAESAQDNDNAYESESLFHVNNMQP